MLKLAPKYGYPNAFSAFLTKNLFSFRFSDMEPRRLPRRIAALWACLMVALVKKKEEVCTQRVSLSIQLTKLPSMSSGSKLP